MEERRRLAVAVGLVVAVCGLAASMMVLQIMRAVSGCGGVDDEPLRRE